MWKSSSEFRLGKLSDRARLTISFQANELQLAGPVPNELYHRYVEFKPFVHGMFRGTGFRGTLLHKALHHQHERVYNYNRETKYGDLPGPGQEMTMKFLDMVHYDQGGRIFTYVGGSPLATVQTDGADMSSLSMDCSASPRQARSSVLICCRSTQCIRTST